jgi:uncharacterized protein
MQAPRFVGRAGYLRHLQGHFDAVAADGSGRLLAVRGRRQCGKSRLLSHFVQRVAVPSFFFSGSRQPTVAADLQAFVTDVAERSTLPGREAFAGAAPATWETALRQLANALPTDAASIVVLDELPWLLERDAGFEGTLQKLWDTVFQHRPVLLVLVGSDLAVMAAIQSHGRPLFGRAKELHIEPFDVADTAELLGIDDPAAAFEAQLITGGYPRLLLEWRRHETGKRFLAAQFADENSDLMIIGARILAAEFPVELQARTLLSTLGSEERSFTGLQALLGVPAPSLQRSLQVLRDDKAMLAQDLPLSTKPSRESRYRIADPYLRFWLRFLEPAAPDIARGRPDLAHARFEREWTAWKGRAIEPLLRVSLLRLCATRPALADVAAVGGYWTRSGDIEIDLVGADRAPVAQRVTFVGSIKWRDKSPFDRSDMLALQHHRPQVPGGERALLVGISRSGFATDALDHAFDAADLLAAWQTG